MTDTPPSATDAPASPTPRPRSSRTRQTTLRTDTKSGSQAQPEKSPPAATSNLSARNAAVAKLLRETNLTQEQAAILVDPKLKPRPVQGLVRVRVLKAQTYLDGLIHGVGAVVSAPQHEAEAAVEAGYAQYLTDTAGAQ